MTREEWSAILDGSPGDGLTLMACADWLEDEGHALEARALRQMVTENHRPGRGAGAAGDFLDELSRTDTVWRWCVRLTAFPGGWDQDLELGTPLPRPLYRALRGSLTMHRQPTCEEPPWHPHVWKAYATYHDAVWAYLRARELLTRSQEGDS